MNNNRYSIYVNQVIELAETMVIKSVSASRSLNQSIVERYGVQAVDEGDLTSWKYYRNLAGEYHFTDKVMTVVSMDTLETIEFSKENLLVHRATARSYVYGTRQYKELVNQYPDQEMLILGIIYPVDIHAAVEAPDGAILGYPPGLIEANEYSLIPKLQDWINSFIVRWVVKGYRVTDSLFTATWMSVMYLNLVPAILTFRLGACKTNEAHSFHVTQYLVSRGMNEAYLEHLTLKQSLWLYRNIDYLLRNIGKQETFDWLMEHLMTERRLPLAEFTMRHDLTEQPEELYPTLAFRKKTLNGSSGSDARQTITLDDMLNKQDLFARSNSKIKEQALPGIQEAMENSQSNVLMTKTLESTVVDYGDGTPYTMNDILMGHWLYLASIDLYQAFISVINPRTGERMPMTVKDAFVFVWYAFCASNGIVLDKVPQLMAKRVQRIPAPSVDDLMSIVDPTMIPRSTAVQALSMQPTIPRLISTEAFYNTCRSIYNAAQMQRNMVAWEEHAVKRGMTHAMISRVYSDNVCTLAPVDQTFASWFGERNIVIEEFSMADLALMYTNIVRDATGLALNTEMSLKDMQRAMVGLMTDLSSYGIQINAEINGEDLIVSDWTAVRVGDIDALGLHDNPVQEMVMGVQDAKGLGRDLVPMEVNLPRNTSVIHIEQLGGDLDMDVDVKLTVADNGFGTNVAFTEPFVMFKLIGDYPENSHNITPVPGIAEWLELPPEKQIDIIDMYDTGLPPTYPSHPIETDDDSLDGNLRVKVLSGLVLDNSQPPLDAELKIKILNGLEYNDKSAEPPTP